MIAPGEGYDRKRPRTPSVVSKILLVRSRPGKQRGLGLKSRVSPAHLFVRLFSACRVSDGAGSRKTRPNHFRFGQDTSDRLLPPVDFTNCSCTRASLFRRLFSHRYALRRGKREATRGSGGSRRRLALGPSTGRDLRSASARRARNRRGSSPSPPGGETYL